MSWRMIEGVRIGRRGRAGGGSVLEHHLELLLDVDNTFAYGPKRMFRAFGSHAHLVNTVGRDFRFTSRALSQVASQAFDLGSESSYHRKNEQVTRESGQ